MLDDLNKIVHMSIEEIISSTHVVTLMKLYSKLYLNGSQPRSCEASLRKYHYELKRDYQMKKEIIERTCIPAWQGRRYIPGVWDKEKKNLIAGHLHIHSEYITDEQATKFLKDGVLKEKDFIRLPLKEGQKHEAKEYSKDELIDIIEKNDYNEMYQVARNFDLAKRKVSQDKLIELLKDYVLTLE